MDATGALSRDGSARAPSGGERCPECAEPFGALPEVYSASLGSVWVRRCLRCGTRAAFDGGPAGVVVACDVCGVAERRPSRPADGERTCGECKRRSDAVAADDRPLARAMERELRAGLAEAWRFVGSPELTSYLERVARATSDVSGAACDPIRIAVFEDDAVRSLALGSGWILVSTGWLRSVRDEAELAFLLAREIEHVRTRAADPRLVRLGCRAAAREDDYDTTGVWAEAGLDLVRLGFGRNRERAADAAACRTVVALGYDPASVLRYLHRLEVRAERGDPAVADDCVAHPPPSDRIARVEREFDRTAPAAGEPRVNREPFRRVAGAEVVSALQPDVPDWGTPPAARPASGPGTRMRILWYAGAVTALAAIVLVVALALAD